MLRLLLPFLFCFSLISGIAQTFEVTEVPSTLSGSISQTLKIPIKIRNTGDKPQFFIVRLSDEDLKAGQKGYFCIDGDCLESGITEFSKRIEGGVSLNGLYFMLETGIVTGQNNLHFEVFVKGNAISRQEHEVNINIDEKQPKNVVFKSKDLVVHDVYPNPVSTTAFIDYELYNEQMKAKIVIHNILGSSLGEQELPYADSRAKISAEDLTPGIYFYTIYIDNEGVTTRKLIVRR